MRKDVKPDFDIALYGFVDPFSIVLFGVPRFPIRSTEPPNFCFVGMMGLDLNRQQNVMPLPGFEPGTPASIVDCLNH